MEPTQPPARMYVHPVFYMKSCSSDVKWTRGSLKTQLSGSKVQALSSSEHCLPWGWFPLKDRSRRHSCLLIIVRWQQIVKTRLVWRFSESREKREHSWDTLTVAVSPPDCWCVSVIPVELVTSSPAANNWGVFHSGRLKNCDPWNILLKMKSAYTTLVPLFWFCQKSGILGNSDS